MSEETSQPEMSLGTKLIWGFLEVVAILVIVLLIWKPWSKKDEPKSILSSIPTKSTTPPGNVGNVGNVGNAGNVGENVAGNAGNVGENMGGNAEPVDCVYRWQPWSPCSANCGKGFEFRDPIILTPSANGGKTCPPSVTNRVTCDQKGDQSEHSCRTCYAGSCSPSDACHYTMSEWTRCSASCGDGTQKRVPNIINMNTSGSCGEVLNQSSRSCNEKPCAPEVWMRTNNVLSNGWRQDTTIATVTPQRFHSMQIEIVGPGGNGGESKWDTVSSTCGSGGGGGAGSYRQESIPLANAKGEIKITNSEEESKVVFAGNVYSVKKGKDGGNGKSSSVQSRSAPVSSGGKGGSENGKDGSTGNVQVCGGDGGASILGNGGSGCASGSLKNGQGPGSGGAGAKCGDDKRGMGALGAVKISYFVM